MKVLAFVALLGVPAAATAAQTQRAIAPSESRAADATAEAYEQYLLSQRLDAARDRDGAIAALKRAMTLDPTSAELPAALADLYLDLDKSVEATAAAEQALKIDASNRDAHRVLGTLYAAAATDSKGAREARQGYLKDAISHLEQAAAERPGLQADANLRAMLARLHILNSDYDKAIPLLTELVRQEEGWQDGPGLLVDAYVSAGRTADAIAWLQQAAPDNPALYSTLADLFGREQRYDDALGVTAAFNLNLLARINRELDGNFDVKKFQHSAIYNDELGRIEIHLVSREPQVVHIRAIELEARFEKGETIRTENSYKFDPDQLAGIARDAGFSLGKTWFDRSHLFSFNLFVAQENR